LPTLLPFLHDLYQSSTPHTFWHSVFHLWSRLSSFSLLTSSFFLHPASIPPSTTAPSMHNMHSSDMVRKDSGNPIEDRKILQSAAAFAQFTPSSKVCLLFLVRHLRATFQMSSSVSPSPSLLSARTQTLHPINAFCAHQFTFVCCKTLSFGHCGPDHELFVSVCLVFAFPLPFGSTCFLLLQFLHILFILT
jgi:hypothetical protein